MSLPGTNASAPCLRPPASALRASTARRVGFTCKSQGRSTVPSQREGYPPPEERMEERLRMPAVVPVPLPACADPRSISAPDTRRLATPNKVRLHAASVTIWRDARVPFRADTTVRWHLCQAPNAFALRLSARRRPISGTSSPASAGFDDLLRARPPFYGSSCDSPRSSIPIRTDRLLLPTASTTSTRASFASGISSRLAPRS